VRILSEGAKATTAESRATRIQVGERCAMQQRLISRVIGTRNFSGKCVTQELAIHLPRSNISFTLLIWPCSRMRNPFSMILFDCF